MSKSTEERFSLIVTWKIKNFSYCWKDIRSSEFIWNGDQFWLEIDPQIIKCKLFCLDSSKARFINSDISFLTCDGSSEESYRTTRGTSYLSVSSSKDIIFGERRNAFLPKDTLTIRCRLNNNRPPLGGKVHIYSTIGIKRSCFMWNLGGDSLSYSGKTLSVENSDLYGNIQLKIRSCGGINIDEQFYIEVSQREGDAFYSVSKISVYDIERKAVNYVSDEFVFEKEERQRVWRFPPFIRKKTLETLRTPLFLKCDFAVSLRKVTDETAVYSYFGVIVPLLENSEDSSKCFESEGFSKSSTDLGTDLKSILDNKILCDVDLQIGSDVIQAHRNILSARSPFFKAMFTKDMKETTSKTVFIEDLNVETVRRVLLYIYSGAIYDYQWENILNLYIAENKYEILGLKEKCSSFMKENLSPFNVCEVLVIADSHQDQGLLSIVHDFISKYSSEVFALQSWKELEKSNSSLALKTLREIRSKK